MPIGSVTGQLRGYRGSTLLGTVVPFNPGGRITVVQPADWRQINHTLNFEVPFAWLTGDVQLEVEVNSDRAVPENNYGNNTASASVRFVDGGGLRIAWLPIHYITGGYTGPNDPTDRITKGDAWLKATYPVSHTRVKYYPWPGITWGGDVNFGTGGIKLLSYLGRLLQLSQMQPRPDHVYAWLPGGVFGSNGLAWLPGHIAFGNDTDGRWRRTFAPSWAQPQPGPLGCDDPRHGFDVAAREVGEDTGSTSWSPAGWRTKPGSRRGIYLPARSHEHGPLTRGERGEGRGRGIPPGLRPDQQGRHGQFRRVYRQSQSDPMDNPPPGTDYCLELYDAGDTKLSSHCFDVSYDFGDSTTPMTTAPLR